MGHNSPSIGPMWIVPQGLQPNVYESVNQVSRSEFRTKSHSMKIDNSSFQRVEEFKYLGKTLTNQNSIQEENKSSWKSGNACYHSVRNLLSSILLSKNLKIKMYGTIICLYGCETWSLKMR